MADSSNSSVLLSNFVVNLPMLKASLAGTDTMSLTHFEVFTEVLVPTPPVKIDHTETLVSTLLISVRVFQVVLLSIDGEAAVFVSGSVFIISLTDHVAPVFAHAFLSVFNHSPENERRVEVEGTSEPHKAHTVLFMEGGSLPVNVADWVFEEARNVLETSPFLTHVLWLFHLCDKFGKVTISIFSESSIITVS